MKIKKYKFVYFDKSLDEYCFGNKLPKHMDRMHTDRYDASFFFGIDTLNNMKTFGTKYSYSELTIMMYNRLKKLYRRALRERQEINSTKVDITNQTRIDNWRKRNEKIILKSRKHLSIWTKKAREVKGSKKYIFEVLMK